MRTYSLFLVTLLCAAGAHAQKMGPYERPLKDFTRYYAGGQADSIYSMFNGQVKAQVTVEN